MFGKTRWDPAHIQSWKKGGWIRAHIHEHFVLTAHYRLLVCPLLWRSSSRTTYLAFEEGKTAKKRKTVGKRGLPRLSALRLSLFRTRIWKVLVLQTGDRFWDIFCGWCTEEPVKTLLEEPANGNVNRVRDSSCLFRWKPLFFRQDCLEPFPESSRNRMK